MVSLRFNGMYLHDRSLELIIVLNNNYIEVVLEVQCRYILCLAKWLYMVLPGTKKFMAAIFGPMQDLAQCDQNIFLVLV